MNKQTIEHDHGECGPLLSSLCDYIDGDLSAELCAEIEKHMKNCDRCRIVVDSLKKTVELYQVTAEDEQMPDEVRERLYMKLNIEDYLK